MIKVIEVSSDTNIGGAGKCILTLLKYFDYDTFDVSVILPANSLLRDEISAMGIKTIEAEGIADCSLSRQGIKELTKIFKREKPDIVHTHGSMSARIAAKKVGAKIVFTRHSVFEPSPKISKGLGKIINGAVNNFYADRIIAVAEAAKDNLTATGVSAKKIDVILNGIEALPKPLPKERERLRKQFGLSDAEKAVSIVARLEKIKGHEYFINAAKELLDSGVKAKFFIAGTGSYEQELRAMVSDSPYADNIIFTGFLDNVSELMAITDVQVNASFGTEATSLALLEGMSIGVPAVVSDFGGNPGVIQSGKNGYVVKKCDAHALAVRIKELLSDERLYKKLSDGAPEIFQSMFTARTMTKKTEDVYKTVLGLDAAGKENRK